nr:hypothetical protein [uncultured Actinoplanes sp.]
MSIFELTTGGRRRRSRRSCSPSRRRNRASFVPLTREQRVEAKAARRGVTVEQYKKIEEHNDMLLGVFVAVVIVGLVVWGAVAYFQAKAEQSHARKAEEARRQMIAGTYTYEKCLRDHIKSNDPVAQDGSYDPCHGLPTEYELRR